MKKKFLKYSLTLAALSSAFFSWWSLDRSINEFNSQHWISPTFWFSFFFIAICLVIILVKERYYLEILSFLCLSLSLIFSRNIFHLLVLIAGFLIFYMAVSKIRTDLESSIKISISKSLGPRSLFLVFSLALVISSQYFFQVKDSDIGKMVPKFNSEWISGKTASSFLSFFNPSFGEDNKSVDELILESQKENSMLNDETIKSFVPDSEAIKELSDIQQEIILQEGRENISELTGSEIKGDEKASEIISLVINNKLASFFKNNVSKNMKVPILPLAMAGILFLAIFSIGSFFSTFLILAVSLIFKILVKFKIINIIKIPAEVETIE